MKRSFPFASAFTLGVLCLTAAALGQGANRGSSSQGMFGQTTLGGTGGASPQGLGQGMTMGMGGSVTNQNPGGVQNGNMNNQLGMAAGASGMQQLQRGGQSGFVGLSSNTVQNPFSSGQQGQRTNQNFSMLTQLMTQGRQNQFNRQQAQRNTRGNTQSRSQFRIPVRVGFEPTPLPPGVVSGELSRRLTKIPGLSQVGPIQTSLEGQTVVLTGTVATEADRQLAEGLARLEPAVMEVRNELVVALPGTTAEALPPGQ